MEDKSTIKKLKQEWKENGYILLKNAISKDDVAHYLALTQEISGLNDDDYQDVIDGKKNPHVNTNQPLVSEQGFWSLLSNETILKFLREIIDPDICFGGADSMFVHRSAGTLHHDTFIEYDKFTGPDFDPNLDTLTHLRAASYLTTNEIIVVPGSHKRAYPDRDRLNFQEFADIAQYVELNPGDILLFDTMLLHAGRYLTRPKYMLVWNYVARNRHTIISQYYTKVTSSMSTKAYSQDFIAYLKQYNLYWEDMFNDEKHLEYFENLWKQLPKENQQNAKQNLDTYTLHWSPYVVNLY